jgi:hypothetical protein
MTVATDAVFEMPDDGDNEGVRPSERDQRNITDPGAGGEADRVDEDNVPQSGLDEDRLQGE